MPRQSVEVSFYIPPASASTSPENYTPPFLCS